MRAAEVEVAVGVEAAHEAAGVAFEVALDLELEAERILVVAAVRVQPHAAEAAVPFQRRAIGDHAELARHAHAAFGIARVVVVAVVPVRVEADRLALQRADRDRERQRLRGAGDVDVAARAGPDAGSRKASAVMPPIELPITQARRSMPSARTDVRGSVGDVLDRQFGEVEAIRRACVAD